MFYCNQQVHKWSGFNRNPLHTKDPNNESKGHIEGEGMTIQGDPFSSGISRYPLAMYQMAS